MNDIQVTFQTILALFGALAAIAGGVKAIAQMFSPFKELRGRVGVCENRLDEHDTYLKSDKDAIADIKNLSRENLRVNIALLNHFIDGNGIDKMKSLREELEDNLLEK